MKVASGSTTVVKIRPDLYPRAHDHVSFLRKLHGLGVTMMTTTTNTSSSTSSSSSSSSSSCWNAQESLRRYTQLWLPLVHESSHLASRVALIPPADIAWLWHCHRLAPAKYEEYLRQKFGHGGAITSAAAASSGDATADDLENAMTTTTTTTTTTGILLLDDPLVPFQFLTPDSPTGASGRTVEFWNMHYPNEPFFYTPTASSEEEQEEQPTTATTTAAVSVERRIKTKAVKLFNHATESLTNAVTSSTRGRTTSSSSSSSSQLLCGFDLLECANRQATFLWQISGPDFHQPVDGRSNINSMALNSAFLARAVQNYQAFVRLSPQARQRGHTLVPTIAVDLIWHTHILSSLSRYKQDCTTLLGDGVEFYHDDTIPSQDLDAAFDKTCQLWKMTYQSDLKGFGGLSRGEPPQEFYDCKWLDIGSKPTTVTAITSVTTMRGSLEQANGNQANEDDDDDKSLAEKYTIGCIVVCLFLLAIVLFVLLGYALDLWETKAYRVILWIASISGIIAFWKICVPKSVRDKCCDTATTSRSGRGRRRGSGSGCGGGGCGGGGGGGGGCGG